MSSATKTNSRIPVDDQDHLNLIALKLDALCDVLVHYPDSTDQHDTIRTFGTMLSDYADEIRSVAEGRS